ncbi:hypothetical protein F4604DRAFT_1681251 [Suillus subluteus]|nr:hypothetical protein F4604DRAFT_1681251 [Suillus subluteus]
MFLAECIHGSLWIRNRLQYGPPIFGLQKETSGVTSLALLCIIVLALLRLVRRLFMHISLSSRVLPSQATRYEVDLPQLNEVAGDMDIVDTNGDDHMDVDEAKSQQGDMDIVDTNGDDRMDLDQARCEELGDMDIVDANGDGHMDLNQAGREELGDMDIVDANRDDHINLDQAGHEELGDTDFGMDVN